MLQNFQYCLNTNFIFGTDAELSAAGALKDAGIHSVLLHHDDGAFLESSGLLARVKQSLAQADIAVTELGGVLPNPRLTLVREGIRIVAEQKLEGVLAIGGGSVIDSAKAIAAGALSAHDVWDFFSKGIKPIAALPLGVILTCPATGSESSDVSVINNTQTKEKLLSCAPALRPRWAFMNPALTFTLPPFLTACGIVDMFSHVCERYFAPDAQIGVIDRMAEGVLATLADIGPKLIKEPNQYSYRAEIMWCGSVAHNDTVGVGRAQDWATHVIANELSALFDTPHGATLSILTASWMRYVYRSNRARFARYAQQVFGVPLQPDSLEQTALEGIDRTERFFESLGMPINFAQGKIPQDCIDELTAKVAYRSDDHCIGSFQALGSEDVRAICLAARG